MNAPELAVLSVGLLCSAGIGAEGARGGQPGSVLGFRARDHVANRKNIKLMARSVQLGVAAVGLALDNAPLLAETEPHRRAMYTGSNPLASEFGDLQPALAAATVDARLDLQRFATEGVPLIHPLWLVKGLSNNVLGFASAEHDFQGANANYCQDSASGVVALWEAAHAILEGRADLAIAGSSDCLTAAARLFPGRPLGEGAAFFLLAPARHPSRWRLRIGGPAMEPLSAEESRLGYLGVAGPTVALARSALSGRPEGQVEEQGSRLTIFTT